MHPRFFGRRIGCFFRRSRIHVREALFLDLSLQRSFGIGAFKPCLGASVDTTGKRAKLTKHITTKPVFPREGTEFLQKPGRYCS